MNDLTIGLLLFILYIALGFIYILWGWREWQNVRVNSRSTLARNLVFAQMAAGSLTVCVSLILFSLWQSSLPFIAWLIMFIVSFFNYGYAFWNIDAQSKHSVRTWSTNRQGPVVKIAVIYYYLLAMLIGIGMPISFVEICKYSGYPLTYFTNDSGRALLLLLLGIMVELLISVLLFISLMLKAFRLKERLSHEAAN